MLLLLFGLSIFCSLDVLGQATNGTIFINIRFGDCPGNKPPFEPRLFPIAVYLVVTDPDTNIVQDVYTFFIELKNWKRGEIYQRYSLKAPLKYKNPSDVKVLLYVKTTMDDKMTGIDNQVFYGRPYFVDYSKFKGKPLDDLGESAFLITKVSVEHEFKSKKVWILEGNDKDRCNFEKEEAWIANHGLYRVCQTTAFDSKEKDKTVIPVFENIYFMPHAGVYFDPKCIHD